MHRKILIAESETFTALGLQRLLSKYSLGEHVTTVSTCHMLLKKLTSKQYTHLITDLYLADGSALNILWLVRKLYPTMRILLFTNELHSFLSNALKLYAIQGYVSKQAEEEYISSLIYKFLSNESIEHTVKSDTPATPFSKMPPREIDVLHYLIRGGRTGEIAKILSISVSAVSTLKRRILERTGTNNISELTDLARLHKII